MFKQRFGLPQLLLGVLVLLAAAFGVVQGQGLDITHELLRDRGLLVMDVVYSFRGDYPFDPNRWITSNFSAIDLGQGRQNIGQAEFYGFDWKLQGNNVNELTPDPCIPPGTDGPYGCRLYYEIGHEPDITVGFSPSVVDYNVLQDLANKYAATRAAYPNVPVTTKLLGGPSLAQHYADSAIQAYIDVVQPDILSSGGYWFFGGSSPAPHDPNYFIRLAQWRQVALNNSLPYATTMQIWYGSDNLRIISESDGRFNQFSTLAYGYKILDGFIYDGWGSSSTVTPVLFSDPRGTANPTELFYQYAASNSEVRNIGSSLVYLLSTDVRYVTTGSVPPRNTAWQAGASDPYITAVQVTNPSPDDLVIGYFKPMLETDDGPSYSNQIYFMIVNGRHGYDLSAAAAQQTIQVDFNFGASGITSLQRLNRATGSVELIAAGGSYSGLTYTNTGATTYRMTLTLPGGTGDLFKFHTGAFFVNGRTCSQLDASSRISADLNGDCYVDFSDFATLAKTWLLCNNPQNPLCTLDCSDPVNTEYCR